MKLPKLFKFKQQDDIDFLKASLNSTNTHIITLARLSFVKPEVLVRELSNSKANAEYITKLIEAKANEQNKSK